MLCPWLNNSNSLYFRIDVSGSIPVPALLKQPILYRAGTIPSPNCYHLDRTYRWVWVTSETWHRNCCLRRTERWAGDVGDGRETWRRIVDWVPLPVAAEVLTEVCSLRRDEPVDPFPVAGPPEPSTNIINHQLSFH